MYIKNLDELMLFVISDGKVRATLCLVRWEKMLCVSQLRSLTSGTVTPSPNIFTVLTDFNFFFIFFCLIDYPALVCFTSTEKGVTGLLENRPIQMVHDWVSVLGTLLFSVTWGD